MINSNACIMSLSKTMSAETTRALTALQDAVSNSFNCTSNGYSSIKQLLSQLGERLKENSLVVIAAEPALFYSAKEVFCQALSLKCENSEDVIASLPTSYNPKNEREYRAVAGFPKHSEILYTPNGLFSGFTIANGTQRIAFVPLEEKLTATLLAGSLGEALARFGDENNIVVSDILDDDAGEPVKAQDDDNEVTEEAGEPSTQEAAAPAAPVAPVAPVAPAAPAAAENAVPSQKSAKEILVEGTRDLIKALNDTGSTLAIAQNVSLKHLRTLIEASPASEGSVVFDETPVEKWQGGKFNEYFANLAKGTFERCGTDYAGAASTLYSDATGRFMFYVVADSQGAKITKVTGNDPNEIIFKTITGLVTSLKERILANGGTKQAAEEDGTSSNEVVKSSTPLVIAAIMLIIAVIASAAVAFYMKGSNDVPDIPETSYVEEITEPETTEEETTEEETSEESEEETSAEEEETSEEAAE